MGSFIRDGEDSRYAYCTNSDVHLQRKDDDELILKLVTPASPRILPFFVVFYADPYFSRVMAVQLIEVQGLRSEHVRVTVGQCIDRPLSLPPAEVMDAGAVRMFCSNPEAVEIPPTAELDARYGAKFTATVTALQ